MEIIGTTLSVARNLAEALQCWEFISDKFSVFSYESELHDLQQTVEKISAVLRDAETKQELSHEAKVVIEALKDAIFEADDLVDEIVTRAHQQKQVDADGTLFEKVSHFFSTSNPICVSYWMSGGIKDIKKKLDAIAYNNQFSINHDPQPIRTRSRDTCSYVNQVDIVGRGDDLEKIVGMLLHPADDQRHNVSFLSVVGIGGLGKTALAQLVFNDPRVKSAFSWTNWTCVADQDQKELDVKEVLCKILERKGSTLEQVQSQLRENLAGKRYFLVLDDVWTESRKQWCDLVKYLIGGQRGSWIVVTTRSHKTAEIVGGQVHKLQGLSEENSWSLFQQSAFTSNPPDELVKIGRKIVDKCAGVPLAIKVVGSFLYGQDRGKWKFVQEKGLANIRQSDNGILSILKLSFHHLEAPLKSCFAYCALFPKDYEMNTEKLKSLWMAQGYVVPLDEGQSIEDACEEYFSILLRRCFFQDIRKDYYGEIRSCKIHDLMHDIALDVSGKEIFCATNTSGGNLDKKVRHYLFGERLETMRERGNYSLFGKSRIRSYLLSYTHMKEYTQFPVDAIVANYRFLRALDLSSFGIKSLSGCMGELLHLRYLDLSHNKDLHELPKSFTKLYNLQTLKLRRCENLTELPKDFSRLVKLRLLDVMDCESLRYMPKGIGKLSCLHWLSDFMVGGGGSSPSWKQWFDSLEDLKALNKLKGRLEIEIRWAKRDRNIIKEDGDKREGLYMRNKEHLNELRVYFIHEEGDDGGKDEELSLMEDLQPHSNLEYLAVENYRGVKMPGWLTLIKNMVSLELNDCGELGYLPCLGNLRNLKSIKLHNLAELEYIGVDDSSWANSNTTMPMSGLGSSDKELSFFPSLKEVELFFLPKLKGWKRGVVGRVEDNILQSQQLLPCFSKLQTLEMYFCLELTCLPSCPDLESLSLIKFNEGLQIMNKKRDEVTPASSSASTSGYEIVNPKLQTLQIDNMAWPNSLPSGYLHRVSSLELWEVEKVDTLNWMLFLPALQTLEIRRCRQMKAIPKWMPKLTSLTTLRFRGNSESLKRRCKKDPPGEDWPYIQHIPNIEFDGSGSEMHASWGDDGKQQSHRLPLPPVTIPSPSPFSHGNSAATSPSVPRSPARGENLPSPTSRWKKGRLLGRGTFGHVYLGFNSETGEMCAMKEVTLFSDDPKSKESAKQLQQEIALLGRLRHPNIVQYYGSETVEDKLYIYLEFVSGGSIYKLLQEYGQLGELAIRSYTQQILSGLAFLHGKNTVHRDIKGANILVDPNGRVKLADFGMAKHITGQSCPLSFKGSPYWMAPEVIKNSNGCNLAVDIWSLGCTVLEMATTKPPWSQYEGVAAMFKIGNSKELPAIPDHLSDEGKDFVKLCLQRDPQQRCTAAQLLEHPFVKNTAPLERPIPSPEPTDTPISASNGMRSLGVGLERNLSSLDSERLAVHSSRVSPARPRSSEYHIPRNISCPVSPIGSPLLHPRSPQHLNGMMSPSPISSPRTTSGSSTPLTGASGAIPYHHSQQSHYMQEGFGALPKSPNSVFLNGPYDPSPNILRGMQSGPHGLTLVSSENEIRIKQVERERPYQGNPCNGRTVLADRVSKQLLREHVKLNPSVEFSPRSTLPSRTHGL